MALRLVRAVSSRCCEGSSRSTVWKWCRSSCSVTRPTPAPQSVQDEAGKQVAAGGVQTVSRRNASGYGNGAAAAMICDADNAGAPQSVQGVWKDNEQQCLNYERGRVHAGPGPTTMARVLHGLATYPHFESELKQTAFNGCEKGPLGLRRSRSKRTGHLPIAVSCRSPLSAASN